MLSGKNNNVGKLGYLSKDEACKLKRSVPGKAPPHPCPHPRRPALTLPSMGTAPTGSHSLRLHICLHAHITIYVHTCLYCMCERTHRVIQLYMRSFLTTQTIIFHASSVYMGDFKSQESCTKSLKMYNKAYMENIFSCGIPKHSRQIWCLKAFQF